MEPRRKRMRLGDPETFHEVNENLADNRQDVDTAMASNDLVRLLLQGLLSLGFTDVAAELERKSKIKLESPSVGKFREHVENGNWQEAEGLLDCLQVVTEDSRRVSLVIVTWIIMVCLYQAIRFLFFEQKYIELLMCGEREQALDTLRTKLATLKYNRERLQDLTLLIFGSIKKDARAFANPVHARKRLLSSIQHHVDPTIMMPPNRLQHLLQIALKFKKQEYLLYNQPSDTLSLLSNFECTERYPERITAKLSRHKDEVWFVKFSNSGTRLASASKDCSAIIWNVENSESPSVSHVLLGHTSAVCYLAWSPDDLKLLTCNNNPNSGDSIKMWDTRSGTCIRTIAEPKNPSCCAWAFDSKMFAAGGDDKSLYLWDIGGDVQKSWANLTTRGMAFFPQRRDLLVASDYEVKIYRADGSSELKFKETETIFTLTLSKDGNYVLLATGRHELHLWDIQSCQIISKYSGYQHSGYALHSSLGGASEAYVASGSDDGSIYLWHRWNSCLVATLQGHTGVVNCVSWCPQNTSIFASCGDDKCIYIWGPKQAMDV
eukprot:m.88168 g.88168  ORF g.88168 m.88168 type:complete len:548 (+) comp13149_c0_seq4:207-1850(+)